MKLTLKKTLSLSLLPFVTVYALQAATTRSWDFEKAQKRELRIDREATVIDRKPIIINKNITYQKQPNIFAEDLDLEQARQLRASQKTAELIRQIEALIKREKQASRLGELKMRLAELYYDQGRIIAARESQEWEARIRVWERLSAEQKAKTKRPDLKTPKADSFRRRSLNLYIALERDSRGADKGQSRMIRRDDVLFYLGSTYVELGEQAKGESFFFELTRKFPGSPRSFAAHLNLGDIYFGKGKFKQAVGEYLVVAKEADNQKDNSGEIKSYALYKAGWCYYNLEFFDKAITAFKKTIESSQSSKSDKKIIFENEAYTDLIRAYAMAGRYSEGEKFYEAQSNKDRLMLYRQTAAQVARDKGHYRVADYFYKTLIEDEPDATLARQMAMERADLIRKHGSLTDYAKALDSLLENYGADSSWMRRQKVSSEDKAEYVEELVGLARREAKNLHNMAQKRKGNELYFAVLPLYTVYLKHVPKPNPDKAETVHEMRFFYAELLYKLGKFAEASEAYEKVVGGKYETTSAYNRILALREAAKKDKSYSKELIRATEAFVAKYPDVQQAGDLLYASAYEAFESGESSTALKALEDVVRRFPNNQRGVDAAERILFIHEKDKNYDAILRTVSAYKSNEVLKKAGGADFVAKLNELETKIAFKKAETMAESSKSDFERKAEAFLALGGSLQGELKEKALNNATVYASKSGNADLEEKAQKTLLAAFPRSAFSKNIYLKEADDLIQKGEFAKAQRRFDEFSSIYPQDKENVTKAQWNNLYIQSHLENIVVPELYPDETMSPALLKDLKTYLANAPRDGNRRFAMSMLGYRKGASTRDLEELKALPKMTGEERRLLEDMEIVLLSRQGRNADLKGIVSRYSSSKGRSDLVKKALAQAKFQLTEPLYVAYEKTRIDLNPNRFAQTLKRKLNSLETLEKEYMGVVAYGDGEYALKSLQRLSTLYRSISKEISQTEEAKKELESFYKPLYEKGVKMLMTCLEKAQEFKIAGSGLDACRSDLAREKADVPNLKSFRIPLPQWVPGDNESHDRPLMKVTARAFQKKNIGEFLLGVDLLERATPAKTAREAAYVANMAALVDWRQGAGRVAFETWSRIASGDDGDSRSLKTAALKNLAALQLHVGDVSGAQSTLSGISEDGDVSEMKNIIRGIQEWGQKK
jgi:tetratricopeptide (TPR) repeat protein